MVKARYIKGRFAGAYLTGPEYVLLVIRFSRRRHNRQLSTREFVVPPLTKALLRFQKRFHGTFRYNPRWETAHFVRVKYK